MKIGGYVPSQDYDGPPAACADCGLAYGDDGWIEAILPDRVWDRIRPESTYPSGGILCITCMARRLKRLGYKPKSIPVYLSGMEPLMAMPGGPNDLIWLLREWDPDKMAKYDKDVLGGNSPD